MRICLVYDHLYPATVGGAERWLHDLAVALVGRGHSVTYLTMRHRPANDPPAIPGVRVLELVSAGRVQTAERRTLTPPVRFGAAVGRHLVRHGAGYDVVHTASFPYFPLLAAAACRHLGRYRLVVDWHEVWTREYWRRYAGPVAGTAGWLVQRACARTPHRAQCMSRMHAERLVREGYRGNPVVLPGLYAGPVQPTRAADVDSGLVVFAGRHIREKRIDDLVRGFATARSRRPGLRLELYGDGPDRPRVDALVRDLGLGGHVRLAGRRPQEDVAAALARAACLASASEREGYGLVVVEAAARGTPSVVVAGPENAAVELVEDGVNGFVAASARPDDLAVALLRAVDAGAALRSSTARWFAANAHRLTLAASLEVVLRAYGDAPAAAATSS